jgi:colanic acid biosynthesis glycosyl transferase WcaI
MVKTPGNHWLILTQYYPPEIGAPQIRLRSTAKEMQRHGIQVEVLTALPNYPAGKIFHGYSGRWKVKEIIDGVPVTRTWVYAGTGKSALIRLANYFSFTLTALIAVLTGPRPDVIFVESQPLSLGLVAVLLKWLRKVPYIYNVPDLQVDVARQMGFVNNQAFLKIAFHLENLFLRQAWKVSTVTHGFIEHFQGRGLPREQITFLPNGADTEFLRPQPASRELLDRWKLDGKKVFVYVGTHAYYHGLETLIEAATLLQQDPEIVFLMVGDGPERCRLQAIVKDRMLGNVIFGTSPYEEMDQLYSIAYASIATLRDIKVANGMRLSKIFPSLSCGVPVIYSGFGEAADLIKAHKCGLAVEPERPSLLAQAIRTLASEPPMRTSFGRAGRALVEKEYSWSAIVERWLGEIGVSNGMGAATPEALVCELKGEVSSCP